MHHALHHCKDFYHPFLRNVVRAQYAEETSDRFAVINYDCNPGTQEVEAEESRVQGKPLLDNEFNTNLGYMILHLN